MSASKVARQLIPMLDRILVKRVEAQTKTATGILIPEKARETVLEGVVLAVGPGAVHPQTGKVLPLTLKEGDRVVLPQFGGSTIKQEGQELLLFRESDILAKWSN